MKKTLLMVSAIALAVFASCNKDNGPQKDIIEDGYYITGAATGVEGLKANHMMSVANNEADGNKKANGVFEKYIVLDANKDFAITHFSAGNELVKGADLKVKNVEGKDDQVKVDFFQGKILDGKAMKVAKAGLYHIILDTKGEQILVLPVEWGVRGVNGNWGWTAMKASDVNHQTMSWTIEFPKGINAGDFKFAYGDGWKIQLDEAGKVKVNTNLGKDMEPGAGNILLPPYKSGKIVLTWTLATGAVSKAYEMKIEGEKTVLDPAELVVGFSGDGVPNGWGDPAGAAKATYNEAESKITDKDNMIGTLVYNVKACEFTTGKEFKVRFNGGWFGGSQVKVTGMKVSGDDNMKIGEGGVYNAKITIDWNLGLAKGVKVDFSK